MIPLRRQARTGEHAKRIIREPMAHVVRHGQSPVLAAAEAPPGQFPGDLSRPKRGPGTPKVVTGEAPAELWTVASHTRSSARLRPRAQRTPSI